MAARPNESVRARPSRAVPGGARAIAALVEGAAALLGLAGLASSAGLCVAAWGFSRRPAECALAASVSAVGFAVVPVHVLGWTDTLTRGGLALTTALATVPVVVATLGVPGGRRRLREALASLAQLVVQGVATPWRERSLALLGVVAALALCAWTAWLAYLAPSSAWDGVMYHEPMVGFALQNRGFAWVGYENGNPMLGPVDGYPRVTENLMLFLVAAWDRRVIDVVPSLLVPILLLGTYVLLRRFVTSRTVALGLAAGLTLLPGVALQLRSTYVDVTFAAFLAAAAAFLCRRAPGPAELWMAGLSLGLAGGSKVTGLMVVPLVGLVGVAITVGAARRRPSLLAHLLGGLALVLVLMAPTYVRNWTAQRNLVWPSSMRMERLGIDWQGPIAITDMNVPADRAIDWLFGPPNPGEQHHDTKDNGYGNVAPFVIPPLALLALAAALAQLGSGRRRSEAWLLLGLTVPLLLTFALTPARHWARLNLHVVLALWVLAAAWLGTARRRLLAEGLVGALVLGGLVTLYWSEPAWDVPRSRLRQLRALSADERAVAQDGIFTLMPTETARARERELGPGDLLVFSRHPFVGLLWNERFSNRVELIDPLRHRGADWVEEAVARGAEWAVVEGRSSLAMLLRESPAWDEVGPADGSREPTVAFRRTSMAPPAAAP